LRTFGAFIFFARLTQGLCPELLMAAPLGLSSLLIKQLPYRTACADFLKIIKQAIIVENI
jgi:hypothetical protein